jgi:hypothetical protein
MTKPIHVEATIEERGINIIVDGCVLPIIYPRQVWQAYPQQLKEVLRDNVALSSTFFVPQILNVQRIDYDTSRPISEAFLFKNGIYDMPSSALTDGASSIYYLKIFLNTVATFRNNDIRLPVIDTHRDHPKEESMIIPFTFGKDSLLTTALAQEIGIIPHLVYFVEPAHLYEYQHKKRLKKLFSHQTGLVVEEVKYEPGKMRYGSLWKIETELGWGLQTTEYALMTLPFLYFYDAAYIGIGNEYSCGEAGLNAEGVLTHWTGYDQHPDWTSQQSLLVSLVGGASRRVVSLVEPLHEIAEVAILHRRYPKFGQFQTSCLAIGQGAEENRWCQRCEKCGVMYTFLKALGVDVKQAGFTEDLLDKNHIKLFDNLFNSKEPSLFYAVEEEIYLAMYMARRRGCDGEVLRVFAEKILPKFKQSVEKYSQEFFSAHTTNNLPNDISKQVLQIYNEELDKIRLEIKEFT